MGECFFWSPGQSRTKGHKTVVVAVVLGQLGMSAIECPNREREKYMAGVIHTKDATMTVRHTHK